MQEAGAVSITASAPWLGMVALCFMNTTAGAEERNGERQVAVLVRAEVVALQVYSAW